MGVLAVGMLMEAWRSGAGEGEVVKGRDVGVVMEAAEGETEVEEGTGVVVETVVAVVESSDSIEKKNV